jgi:hypothetical protein
MGAMSGWNSGDNLVWARGVGPKGTELHIIALLESKYSDEVSLLWFQPGSSC